ncbi:Uncharacterised protein [Vibrio cholerae]|nr:Uncharacterised protein [Vibrio cholerae]
MIFRSLFLRWWRGYFTCCSMALVAGWANGCMSAICKSCLLGRALYW